VAVPPTSPAVRLEPIGAAKRDGPGWRTTWRLVNTEATSVRVIAAIAPHSKFRGENALGRDVAGKGTTQFSLVTLVDGRPGSEIENAFVIVLIQRADDRWRMLVRLRVPLDQTGKPQPRVEAMTMQRVGFSGEF
jgi:hypothetical protein